MNQAKQLRIAAKNRAKVLLFSNLGKCVLVSLIFSAIGILGGFAVSSFVPATDALVSATGEINMPLYTSTMLKTMISGVLISIISCPLAFGMYEVFINLVRNKSASIGDMFNWFGEGKRFLKAIGSNLWFSLISMGWALLFELIPLVLMILLVVFIDSLDIPMLMLLYVVLVILIMIGAVLAMVKTQYYIVAMYMIAGDPERKVRDTFRECKSLMKGRQWEFFVLYLSFFGWQLLAAFTCGMSVVFVTPYMNLTFAAYTEHIMAVNGYAAPPEEEKPESNEDFH